MKETVEFENFARQGFCENFSDYIVIRDMGVLKLMGITSKDIYQAITNLVDPTTPCVNQIPYAVIPMVTEDDRELAYGILDEKFQYLLNEANAYYEAFDGFKSALQLAGHYYRNGHIVDYSTNPTSIDKKYDKFYHQILRELNIPTLKKFIRDKKVCAVCCFSEFIIPYMKGLNDKLNAHCPIAGERNKLWDCIRDLLLDELLKFKGYDETKINSPDFVELAKIISRKTYSDTFRCIIWDKEDGKTWTVEDIHVALQSVVSCAYANCRDGNQC